MLCIKTVFLFYIEWVSTMPKVSSDGLMAAMTPCWCSTTPVRVVLGLFPRDTACLHPNLLSTDVRRRKVNGRNGQVRCLPMPGLWKEEAKNTAPDETPQLCLTVPHSICPYPSVDVAANWGSCHGYYLYDQSSRKDDGKDYPDMAGSDRDSLAFFHPRSFHHVL